MLPVAHNSIGIIIFLLNTYIFDTELAKEQPVIFP